MCYVCAIGEVGAQGPYYLRCLTLIYLSHVIWKVLDAAKFIEYHFGIV